MPPIQLRLGVAVVAIISGTAACRSHSGLSVVLETQHPSTGVRLQAVSVVTSSVAWASGLAGTYARTLDGGTSWTVGVVPGADSLQFRDVHAVSADTAYLLSAGSGALSRIYQTTDGGAVWTLQFMSDEPRAFFDCLDFWDGSHGVAFSDAVDGQFIIMRTEDGRRWERVPPEHLPPALPGEGSFAASGTCVIVRGTSDGWIGTGNASRARILETRDRGRTWTAAETPVVAGEAAGITSVAFADARQGAAAGGEIGQSLADSARVAATSDGGLTWRSAGAPTFPGAVYGVAYVPDARPPILVAVGPGGASYSVDHGARWWPLDTLGYWGLGFAGPAAGWLAGPAGRITKVSFRKRMDP
ncbi:MAG: hypothetical protein OER90_10125 [Gemmatimonadota bacterium]|nr:hypothetical protein [Gemmatimonadota bacterium]